MPVAHDGSIWRPDGARQPEFRSQPAAPVVSQYPHALVALACFRSLGRFLQLTDGKVPVQLSSKMAQEQESPDGHVMPVTPTSVVAFSV